MTLLIEIVKVCSVLRWWKYVEVIMFIQDLALVDGPRTGIRDAPFSSAVDSLMSAVMIRADRALNFSLSLLLLVEALAKR